MVSLKVTRIKQKTRNHPTLADLLKNVIHQPKPMLQEGPSCKWVIWPTNLVCLDWGPQSYGSRINYSYLSLHESCGLVIRLVEDPINYGCNHQYWLCPPPSRFRTGAHLVTRSQSKSHLNLFESPLPRVKPPFFWLTSQPHSKGQENSTINRGHNSCN